MSVPTLSSETHLDEIFGPKQSVSFDHVRITVANPETIRSWSRGEVKNPETINYRTFKPEKGGLFCERIFGPTKDWECACGKYKRIKHKGTVCDRCGVEVTLSHVRRERMGHIELAVPVSHIWFHKRLPSRIGLMLDMSARQLERVIYYEDYIVIEPGNTPLEAGQLLTGPEYRDAQEEYGMEGFQAGMGAEAIGMLLSRISLEGLVGDLEEAIRDTDSKSTRKKLAMRLKVAKGFLRSNTRPEWMILEVLPVIPPDLRPIVPLENGRFASSDLNDLYRRVINRNNRLKNLLQLKTEDVIIRNEKRMLQETVDALFDNGRHGRAVTGPVSYNGNRALKSLSDCLKGNGGRFRQNLLGKRVDYSGRSVIVPGPELQLHQCGLPKKMALVLFEPFIIRRLKELGYVHTVRSAKKLIERKTLEVWDSLEEVTKEHPVLLNRPPTLHRLSIQAFEPVLVEGSAIRLHPLTCSAYNADFDGDQMAVHVPLSVECQLEARLLMSAAKNFIDPANGKPIMPSQDISLGAYFMTCSPLLQIQDLDLVSKLPLFSDTSEVEFAVANRSIDMHDPIRLRNPDFETEGRNYGDPEKKVIVTTAGRVRFNEIWPENLGFFNGTVGKKQLSDIIWHCYQVAGQDGTVVSLDALKALGFKEATRSGTSVGIFDMIIPDEKEIEVTQASAEVKKANDQYRAGVITNKERYNKIVDIWTHAGDEITKALFRTIEHNEGKDLPSPLFMMIDSGARVNRQQIKQLSGMRGLMAKPSGEIIERPIISNFRSGLSVLEYFISTHGARKGLADTALKTADSGYMTRKLVDVAQDVIITEEDCGTANGITVKSIYEGDEEVVDLKTRIYGRVAAEKVVNGDETVVKPGDMIDEEVASRLNDIGHKQLKVRSVVTCESYRGCCSRCYGIDLGTGYLTRVGEPVGIVAAHSIGNQVGRSAMTLPSACSNNGRLKESELRGTAGGIFRFDPLRTIKSRNGEVFVASREVRVTIEDERGDEIESHLVRYGYLLHRADGEEVESGDLLASWDAFSEPLIADNCGRVVLKDVIRGVNLELKVDSFTGKKALIILDDGSGLYPQIQIIDPVSGQELASYSISAGANLIVEEGQMVNEGQLLAKFPIEGSALHETRDFFEELNKFFEAEEPEMFAELAKMEGEVLIDGIFRNKQKVRITDPETGEESTHLIPANKRCLVRSGDYVSRGQKMTAGALNPHHILDALGEAALADFFVEGVQGLMRSEGLNINDKHFEIILRQMLRTVNIVLPGDSEYVWGQLVARSRLEHSNSDILERGGEPGEGRQVLLGITKVALKSQSFVSAAASKDSIKVLTEAVACGEVDTLEGHSENVILGQMIPSGSGYPLWRNMRVCEMTE